MERQPIKHRRVGSSVLAITVLLGSALLYGAMAPRHDDGMGSRPQPLPAPTGDAVTFIAFGDPQFGGDDPGKNSLHVRALNAVEGKLRWDAKIFGADVPVTGIRGVIIAGDLTQNGRDGRMFSDDEYGAFLAHYGLTGDRRLRYPVYEGYGNHDYFVWNNIGYRVPKAHPVADSVSIRNRSRPGVLHAAPGTAGHYSWEWGRIHFVMLNLCASDRDPGGEAPGARDPRGALSFLRRDLERHMAGTGKRVVVVTHYGFHEGWDFPNWWTEEEAAAYHDVIREYNLIGHIHGHNHGTQFYRWKGLPVFDAGSPYYTGFNRDGRGHFTLFRVSDEEVWAADVSWDPEHPETNMLFPAGWHARFKVNQE